MSDIKFFEKVSSEIENSNKYKDLKNILREKAEDIEGTIYVIQNPLYSVEENEKAEIKDNYIGAFVILIPKTKIIFTTIDDMQTDEFDDYFFGFIDSITTLNGVFGFKNKIGNSRKWGHLLQRLSIDEINLTSIDNLKLNDSEDLVGLEILISLISGSINTPDKGGQAHSILDAVRKRIVQFDGDQTRFVYDEISKKEISIQGSAGTGKTELLFHRLVYLYNQTDGKIVFTCNSKILANDIKLRLPKFLDQMKVSRREDIDERIKVMRSWGSRLNPESGVYSYICNFYDLDFINYSMSGVDGFDGVCLSAISQLEDKKRNSSDFSYCFDYILIDEAQDFSDSFFKLCEMVTSNQVIVASDIFQKIYYRKSNRIQNPDFTLNKVYRTDPKNFMFSQFLGFGLKEKPVIQWFDSDEDWGCSGYSFTKRKTLDGTIYEFSREPINRFNDIKGYEIIPTKINYGPTTFEIVKQVLGIIDELRAEHSDITPSDIGIVFVSKGNEGYKLADNISANIKQRYNWETQKVYEEVYKTREKNKVFISNQNNVKGLEFSFLIGIVLDEITQDLESRNMIYMLMTRSFLTSYLILGNSNKSIYDLYEPMLNEILSTGKVSIIKPKKENILQEEQIKDLISSSLTLDQKIEKALKNKGKFTVENTDKLKNMIKLFHKSRAISIPEIETIIESIEVYLDE